MIAHQECSFWHTSSIQVRLKSVPFKLLIHILVVYYRDSAMRLQLPSRALFEKKTASLFVIYLIDNARLMLQNEQKREQKGGAAEGDILVKQMIGMWASDRRSFFRDS